MAVQCLKEGMKWGTSKGIVVLNNGDKVPEVDKVSAKVLDRLWRRGWITDPSGTTFNRRPGRGVFGGASGPAKVEVKKSEPKPEPKAEPETENAAEAELGKLTRKELEDVAEQRGLVGVEAFNNKGELIEAILGTEE